MEEKACGRTRRRRETERRRIARLRNSSTDSEDPAPSRFLVHLFFFKKKRGINRLSELKSKELFEGSKQERKQLKHTMPHSHSHIYLFHSLRCERVYV